MTNDIKQLASLAKDISEAALEEAKRANLAFKQRDYSMMRLHFTDAADMIKVAEYLFDLDIKGAKKLAWQMDTAARDKLPDSFNSLMKLK